MKVFTRNKNGQVGFWKDGYTDLRGKFNYAVKSQGSVGNIEKYSILIVSVDYGSQIKEVGPPSKIGKKIWRWDEDKSTFYYLNLIHRMNINFIAVQQSINHIQISFL